jgi:hypothetical protein
MKRPQRLCSFVVLPLFALALDASAAAPIDPAKTTTAHPGALAKPKVTFTREKVVRDPALRYASFGERQITHMGDVTLGAINLPDGARLRVMECFVHDNDDGGPAGNELKLVASAYAGQAGGGRTLVQGTVKLERHDGYGRAHVIGLDHIIDNFATEYYVRFDRGTGTIKLDGCTFGFVPPPPM